MPEKAAHSIIHPRLLAKNTIYNVIGQSFPLIFAVFSIPIIIHQLGTEKFGLLTLSWVILGYFSSFDFGISRALTQLICAKLGSQKNHEIPHLIWFSLMILLGLGIAGGIILASLSYWLVFYVLKIPPDLQAQTLYSFYLVSFCIPIVLISNALQAILAAYQRFDLINIIRIPLGIVNYLGPLCVIPFSKNIFWIIMFLVIIRIALLLINIVMCGNVMPEMFTNMGIHLRDAKFIMIYGGWTTVSNFVGLFIINLDKIFIGSIISIGAVAYYSTPFELVGKILIIPTAFMGVMFPAFSLTYFSNKEKTVQYFNKANRYLFLSLFPLILVLFIFTDPILSIWLGKEFAEKSTLVLQIFCIGVLVNGMAQVPLSLMQGIGRPDLLAILHICEVPFYLLALWFGILNYGINGAAAVWTIRVIIDAFLMYYFAYHQLKKVSNG